MTNFTYPTRDRYRKRRLAYWNTCLLTVNQTFRSTFRKSPSSESSANVAVVALLSILPLGESAKTARLELLGTASGPRPKGFASESVYMSETEKFPSWRSTPAPARQTFACRRQHRS